MAQRDSFLTQAELDDDAAEGQRHSRSSAQPAWGPGLGPPSSETSPTQRDGRVGRLRPLSPGARPQGAHPQRGGGDVTTARVPEQGGRGAHAERSASAEQSASAELGPAPSIVGFDKRAAACTLQGDSSWGPRAPAVTQGPPPRPLQSCSKGRSL